MYVRRDRTILTDCDGVLLDWEYAFDAWMNRHGYSAVDGGQKHYDLSRRYSLTYEQKIQLVTMFNESAVIRKMPPLRDAVHYVRKLHLEHGYTFHAITSLSSDEYAQHLRTKNLRELFGDTVFDRYVYLSTGADKDEALAPYEGSDCVWVEDKVENADLGMELGLDSILMAHEHNSDYEGGAMRVSNWKEIYEYLT